MNARTTTTTTMTMTAAAVVKTASQVCRCASDHVTGRYVASVSAGAVACHSSSQVRLTFITIIPALLSCVCRTHSHYAEAALSCNRRNTSVIINIQTAEKTSFTDHVFFKGKLKERCHSEIFETPHQCLLHFTSTVDFLTWYHSLGLKGRQVCV